ncbi:MAG: polyprenyl diphosphate synthase [bacterium]|nr:polyprenyl diphosphate synthase [bacterium]
MDSTIPNHIAIIPDGNRRWAKAKGFASIEGHREGAERFREVSEAAFKEGISYFTFWAVSDANIVNRSVPELTYLFELLRKELVRELETGRLIKDDVRFHVVGWWEELARERNFVDTQKLRAVITELETRTAACTKRHLTILFGYGGRREMHEAVNRMATDQSLAAGTEEEFRRALATWFLPDVDLVIRTGEPQDRQYHESEGFLMYLTADAVKQFPAVMWPDFTPERLREELKRYADFERRRGA